MSFVRQSLSALPPLLAMTMLAACTTPAPVPPRPTISAQSMVAAIHAAGAREKSVIAVHPLIDPGVTALQDAAQADEQAGRFEAAAAKLDQAIKRSPQSPDLLQDRAEVALYLHDYKTAAALAQQSWTLGPKLGPLCARNWETIAQLRLQDDDQDGAATARKWVATCHKQGVNRF